MNGIFTQGGIQNWNIGLLGQIPYESHDQDIKTKSGASRILYSPSQNFDHRNVHMAQIKASRVPITGHNHEISLDIFNLVLNVSLKLSPLGINKPVLKLFLGYTKRLNIFPKK